MLEALKFVQGSVAKKDFLPALTHFVLEGSKVRGFNGTIALSSRIDCDLVCKPKADTLIRAIGNCKDAVQLSITPAGRLSVKSGGFKAFIDCVDGETPHVLPSGPFRELGEVGALLIAGLKKVSPFIGDDASRAWSNGVLLRDRSLYATNNVTLVQFWLDAELPLLNLPRMAVKELLRIGEAPFALQCDDQSATFHYDGDRWLRTQLLPTDWPDLQRVLDVTAAYAPIETALFEGLDVVKPFADKLGRVFFRDGQICTHTDDTSGASYDVPNLPPVGVYNAEMLDLLRDTATHVDFGAYPKPCLFHDGDKLRGAIIGMRE